MNFTAIDNLPSLTIGFLSITVILSALTSLIRTQAFQPGTEWEDVIVPMLQVVPSSVFYYPWTLWTATFVETSPLQFILALVIITFGITWLENYWNFETRQESILPETFKFVSIITILTNFISVLTVIIVHLIIPEALSDADGVALFHPLRYGIYNLILPLSVVAKQLSPEVNLKLYSLKFRLKRLPIIMLSFSAIISLLCGTLWPLIPAWNSMFFAWVYLRYWQVLPSETILPGGNSTIITGDSSSLFDFVTFFPEAIQPKLKNSFDKIYDLSILLGLIRAWNEEDLERAPRSEQLKPTDGVTADERRKMIALKVLEEEN
ncbi:hypothetical protein DAMA08_053410 [Martiniozyma asiatica (nom. inval.)]|nr:hypothetical protein DAMA08_053410 [Martiniozyma asiatica]